MLYFLSFSTPQKVSKNPRSPPGNFCGFWGVKIPDPPREIFVGFGGVKIDGFWWCFNNKFDKITIPFFELILDPPLVTNFDQKKKTDQIWIKI